jgi:LmbE family N-acetylglucosaminyl deacetylase
LKWLVHPAAITPDMELMRSTAANGVIGIPEKNIFFVGYDDGMLEYVPEKELAEKVRWFIRKYRPDALFCFDPGSSWVQWHKTDHRMAAKVALDGARAEGVITGG